MSKLRVQSFTLSLDGYGAGPHQDLQNPLGIRGPELMEWLFATRLWQQMYGGDRGETGVDNDMAVRGFANLGAWIIGRNMFGPIRGPWPDESWKGWWGEEPPYHVPVFVLTHHPRPSLTMAGGTVFTSSRKVFKLRSSKLGRPRMASMCDLAVVYPRFGNTCAKDGSTNCTWSSGLCCLEPESTCFKAWICRHLAMNVPNGFPVNAPPMRFFANGRDTTLSNSRSLVRRMRATHSLCA
jgi:dihydrofolate reductase